jgi:antibiotic biosynthesis monooxygenase (ABM) superfamily enzyme
VIERHITFSVHPDQATEFERFFVEEYRPAMSASPGFVRAELLRETEEPSRYQMSFRFQDAATATAWRTSGEHQALQPALNALHESSEIQGYEVIA